MQGAQPPAIRFRTELVSGLASWLVVFAVYAAGGLILFELYKFVEAYVRERGASCRVSTKCEAAGRASGTSQPNQAVGPLSAQFQSIEPLPFSDVQAVSSSNIASTGSPKRRALRNAKGSEGSCLPVSMAFTVCRETLRRPASFAWLQLRSVRSTLRELFTNGCRARACRSRKGTAFQARFKWRS